MCGGGSVCVVVGVHVWWWECMCGGGSVCVVVGVYVWWWECMCGGGSVCVVMGYCREEVCLKRKVCLWYARNEVSSSFS